VVCQAVSHRLQRLAGQAVRLFLVDLGAEKAQHALIRVKVGRCQPGRFAHAQPVVEQQAHQQAVAPALRGGGLLFERLRLFGG